MDNDLLQLVAGLDLEEVFRRLDGALRMLGCGNRALAFYLWELEARGLCQQMGDPNAAAFAERELGISRRHAQELIATGRELLELKEIDRAFREGEICWSKVRVLVRVATVETEQAWLERAKEVNTRELAGLAKRAGPGEKPADAGSGGLPVVRFQVTVELDALAYEEWTQAKRKLGAEIGQSLTDAEAMRFLAQMMLATRADGSVPGRVPVEDSIYRVVIDAERAHVRADDGAEAAPAAVIEAAASDAAVSPALRKKVLERDGHRFVSCGYKGYLHAHHVEWWSRGGKTELRNLAATCACCHALVHKGYLVMEGEAGTGLQVRPAQEVPRHPAGMAMSLDTSQAPEPPLTLDSIPAVVSASWWIKHEHLLVWQKDGTVRLKAPRARARK